MLRRGLIGILCVIGLVALAAFFLRGSTNLGPTELLILLVGSMIYFASAAAPLLIVLLVLWKLMPAKKKSPRPHQSPEAPPSRVGQTTDKLLVEPSPEASASITEDPTRSLEKI